MNWYRLLCICLLFVLPLCGGHKILAIFPYHGRSHMGGLREIAKALASKGHQVDVISHFPLENPHPNYTDIIRLPNIGHAALEYDTFTIPEKWDELLIGDVRQICSYLGLAEIQKLIKNELQNPTYDLLLNHDLSTCQCTAAIGHVLDIPVVSVVTTKLYTRMNMYIGNPLNLAISPCNTCVWNNEIMTFWDRLYNVVATLNDLYNFHRITDRQEIYLKKYLGPEIPHYEQLEKSVALMLSNSHYSLYGVQPKTSALVEIGGIHIRNDTTPMERGLKKFLDESKDGFIYFSFGSLTVLESFPNEILESFYAAFRHISPVRIVMKVANPKRMPKNVPDNVLMQSWLPQLQILQHSNIKGFVTHGGAHGTQEAIYHAVPMICIPFFSEQNLNCDMLERKHVGLKLKLQTGQQDFLDAFHEIISNSEYKYAITKLSALFRDRPQTPSEEAVYWIEYVLRHGRDVLKSPAVDLKWWQIELFDVYAFIALCILLILSITILVVRWLFMALMYMKNSRNENIIVNKKSD